MDLNINRRSSKPILKFANRFVTVDGAYQAARRREAAAPAARDRRAWTASDRLPVVGLFRPDVATLAQDATAAIEALLGAGWKLPGGRLAVSQPGDIAVLAPTTAAITESFGKTTRRVYAELGDNCAAAKIEWFNPRGTRLADVPCVQQLLGLALKCIDPAEQYLPNFVWTSAAGHMTAWRAAARALIKAQPEPRKPPASRRSLRHGRRADLRGGGVSGRASSL